MGATAFTRGYDRCRRTGVRRVKEMVGTVTFNAAYAAGGDDFDPCGVPAANYISVLVRPPVGANMPVPVFDAANKKLMAFGTAASATGLTQIAAGQNLSLGGAMTYRALIKA